MPDVNTRYTPNGAVESKLREQVRHLLDLDWSARDERILAEIKRLKDVNARVTRLAEVAEA